MKLECRETSVASASLSVQIRVFLVRRDAGKHQVLFYLYTVGMSDCFPDTASLLGPATSLKEYADVDPSYSFKVHLKYELRLDRQER